MRCSASIIGIAHDLTMSYSPQNEIGDESAVDSELIPLQRQLSLLSQYLKNQDCENARGIATTLSQKFPNHPDPWRALADLYRRKGRSWNALGAQKKLLELQPNDAETHFDLALLYGELGLANEELTAYFQTLLLDPDFDQAYVAIGQKLQRIPLLLRFGTFLALLDQDL